jgi:hypothetical protein
MGLLVPYRYNGGDYRFYTRLSVSPFTMFSRLFSAMCAAISLKYFVHGFVSMTYRSSSKMVAIDQFLDDAPLNLVILRDFTVFRTFFSILTYITLIFGTLICHTKMQIKCEFGFDPLIFRFSYSPWT